MQKVLITGGGGFIGSNLINRCLNLNLIVHNIDVLTYAANTLTLNKFEQNKNYFFSQIDICEGEQIYSVLKSFKPDYIFHLAAESHVDNSIQDPSSFLQTNIIGTAAMLNAVRQYISTENVGSNFKFHHISTDEVFGDLDESGYFDEDTNYNPSSPYSASKASSDLLVKAWGRTFNVPFVITNCSNNYGPYQHPEKFIPVIISSLENDRKIPIYGMGANVRDWLYVEDHVDALLSIMNANTGLGHICIGGETELSNKELVAYIIEVYSELTGKQLKFEDCCTFVEDRLGHDFRYAINNTLIRKHFNWLPKTSLDLGIRKTVSWYLENRSWSNNFLIRKSE